MRVNAHPPTGRAAGGRRVGVQPSHLLRVGVQADRDVPEVPARPLGVACVRQEVHLGADLDPVVVVLKVVAGVRFLGKGEG